jgi:hypothetical protein
MDGDAWATLSIDKEELPKLVEVVNQELAKSGAFLSMAVGGG